LKTFFAAYRSDNGINRKGGQEFRGQKQADQRQMKTHQHKPSAVFEQGINRERI
jgi:hypothetical protein